MFVNWDGFEKQFSIGVSCRRICGGAIHMCVRRRDHVLTSNEFILLSEQNSPVRGIPEIPTPLFCLRQHILRKGFQETSLTSEFVGLYPQIHCLLRQRLLKLILHFEKHFLWNSQKKLCQSCLYGRICIGI